ncbi:MAG TPA: hypothetical protein VNO24_30870 [Blastocatellia bacterium]|nr:hypothetical protein [Blastocatellia bacterium]
MIRHRIILPPDAHELIDEFMPVYDASEFHETTVHAPIEKVYDALRTANLGDSPIIRFLLRLRELPAMLTTGGRKRNLKLNLDAIIKGGFVLLGENPPNEIALGLVGRFWTLSGSRFRVNAEEFASFDLPGYAKAVWNFSLVEESAELTRLATETRVRCMDDASRWRFRLYWALIAPFSGLIRREALRTIRRSSESKL